MDKPRAKLTDERRKKIKARVREGYAFETFQRAIDACARSPFHNGENDKGNAYQDLTLICRTGSKLEWFCDDLHAKTPRRPGEETIEEFKERGKAQGDRILASGILDDLRSDSEPSSSGATYEHE